MSVRCEVLLFAQLAEAIGERSLSIELPDGATVADALTHLGHAHDAVAALEGRLAVAVDEAYAPKTAVVTDGCTIALIPPVSGG